MMMTIEEAWKAVDDAHWWSLRAMDDEQIEAVVDERLATRALLVAVLEESSTGWHADITEYLAKVVTHHEALCARIAALGQE